jgi:hypothetical protein
LSVVTIIGKIAFVQLITLSGFCYSSQYIESVLFFTMT